MFWPPISLSNKYRVFVTGIRYLGFSLLQEHERSIEMEQIDGDLFTYSVEAHETVVIEVTPFGVGNFASVNIDSKAQPKSFSYSFPVTKPSDGEHDVVMEIEFPGAVDPNARYDVK